MQTIICPTPNCTGTIEFDPHLLIQGVRFECSVCKGAVSLTPESKPVMTEAMEKFDKMKSGLLKEKKK